MTAGKSQSFHVFISQMGRFLILRTDVENQHPGDLLLERRRSKFPFFISESVGAHLTLLLTEGSLQN